MNEPIIITPGDKQSAAWAKLQEYWTQQLGQLRVMNDADLDPVATAKVRGRIVQIKAFLSMDQDMPQVD